MTLTFTHALDQAELLARQALPTVQHERLSCAVALVKAGQVVQLDDHTWQVASQHTPEKLYHVNGTCDCEDSTYRAPKGLCKHVLATLLARKTLKLMQGAPEPLPALDPAPEPALAPAIPDSLKPHILVLHNKPFVQYAGLLAHAHERGLVSLTAQIEFHSDSLVLASATATFADGRTFTEWADATPSNVKAHVRPHFPRMALTRAKARCLRDALNIGLTALEELEEVEP